MPTKDAFCTGGSSPPAVPSVLGTALATLRIKQPKRRRKGRKSMSRRRGQNGTIVIQSGWYRVRWRIDAEGQEQRINMSEKIAPAVFDRQVTLDRRHLKFGVGRRKSSTALVRTQRAGSIRLS